MRCASSRASVCARTTSPTGTPSPTSWSGHPPAPRSNSPCPMTGTSRPSPRVLRSTMRWCDERPPSASPSTKASASPVSPNTATAWSSTPPPAPGTRPDTSSPQTACGRRSARRSVPRSHGYRGEWHAFRQYFSSVGPRAQHLVVWFEPDLLPGYAWSFPLPGRRANVGFGIQRGGDHDVGDMGALWQDLLARPHVRDVLGPTPNPRTGTRRGRSPHASTRWSRRRPGALDRRRRRRHRPHDRRGHRPGPALGTPEPPRLSPLRALTIPTRCDRPSTMTSPITWCADHRCRPLIRATPLATQPGAALRAANATPWTRRNFARWMFEDYPRALVLTPRRWHRVP